MTRFDLRWLLLSVWGGVCLLVVAAAWQVWPSPATASDTYGQSAYGYDGSSLSALNAADIVTSPAHQTVSAPAGGAGFVYDSLQYRYATKGAELPGLSVNSAQLEAKFKHAADFGVVEARGASGFDAFGKAVDAFVADLGTVRVVGTYRGNPAILNYNPTTAQVVVQATDGAFISGWKMSSAQLQNVITRASLGGG